MRALYKPSFKKDFRSLEPGMRRQVEMFCIDVAPAARSKEDLVVYGAKKLTGWKGYYRVRIGNYRIGLKVDGSIIIFMHVLDRKEIYRHFP